MCQSDIFWGGLFCHPSRTNTYIWSCYSFLLKNLSNSIISIQKKWYLLNLAFNCPIIYLQPTFKNIFFIIFPPTTLGSWSFSAYVMHRRLLCLHFSVIMEYFSPQSECSSSCLFFQTRLRKCLSVIAESFSQNRPLCPRPPFGIFYNSYSLSLTWPSFVIRENFILFEGINCLIHLHVSLLPSNIWQKALHRVNTQ